MNFCGEETKISLSYDNNRFRNKQLTEMSFSDRLQLELDNRLCRLENKNKTLINLQNLDFSKRREISDLQKTLSNIVTVHV